MKKLLSLLMIITLFSAGVRAQTLTGIIPNSIVQGQTNLDATITGPGVFLQQSSQEGNVLEMHLQQGATNISIFDVNNWFGFMISTYNDSSVIDNFAFPALAPTGMYDLSVTVGDVWGQQTYSLPAAFQVLVPDGYANGNLYEDLNLNGAKDPGEPNLSSQVIVINPGNMTIATDVNGNFSYPLTNGTYTASWQNNIYNYLYLTSDSANYTFTISNNNANGLDFGLRRSLTNITPNSRVKGYSVSTIIESRGLFSGTGSGNVSLVRLYRQGNSYIYNISNTLNVIDSNTLAANFLIPSNALTGSYTIILTLTNNNIHYLPAAFNVLNPEAYLTGKVYLDMNSNGVEDTGEPGILSQRILSIPDSIYGYSDNYGNYSIGVILGTHTVQWKPVNPASWILTSDSSSFTVSALSNVDSLDFGIRTTNPTGSVSTSINSSFPRCNTNHIHRILYNNISNAATDANLYFIKSPLMSSVLSSPIPTSTNGDTLIWNFTNVTPFVANNITITSNYPGGGTIVDTKSIFNSVDALGNILYSDTSLSVDHVVCAYDPNDKAVTPEGVGQDHLTLNGELLDYKIRFQNTGNDTAFNVVIYDNLDPNLDYNTLQVIASSHSVQTEIDTDGRVAFTFANILLPDSNVNEPASNGFVRYTILPKAGLADSTVVTNKAFIVFDSNPAVVTNKTFNTYVFVIPVGLNDVIVDDVSAIIYPNPFSDYTNIIFNNANNEKYVLKVYDVSGKIVQQRSTNSGRILLERENMKSGIYFYNLMNTAGTKKLSGKIITE